MKPRLFDLVNIGLSQDGEDESLDLLPDEDATRAILEQDYRDWRQIVGRETVEYNLDTSTADLSGGCVDITAAGQYAELETNELLTFREGDFSFQTQLELNSVPDVGGAVIAEHPGSWTLSLEPDVTPGDLLVRLDIRGKNSGIAHPGAPGDLITLTAPLACAAPCSANIAFTVLGFSYTESGIRLYVDGTVGAEQPPTDNKTAPLIREVYASGTEEIFLGNSAAGDAAIDGRLVDPRFYTLTLTPAEVSAVLAEQNAAGCGGAGCHP